MAEIKLRALGLREVDFGDYDRYVTALTEQGRRIEILCKGARRGKKQIPAARQLCFSELILSERGGKYTLREGDVMRSFFDLSQDIEKYALACYFAEAAAALTTPDEDAPAIFRATTAAMAALSGGKRENALVKAAFEWRVTAESGFFPDMTACAVCGCEITEPPVCFSVSAGQIACPDCAQRVGGYAPLHAGALQALVYVLNRPPERIYSFALGGAARTQFCEMAEQYAQYHFGRGFDSLRFYHSVCAMPTATK